MLATKFIWNEKYFNFINYFRDQNLIFIELSDIWNYQNTSYLIEYNKLLKSCPFPNNQVICKLINIFFKKNLRMKIVM